MNIRRFVFFVLFELVLIAVATHSTALAQPSMNGLAFWLDATDINGDGVADNPANATHV